MGILVFCEDKNIKENLKPYKSITERIVNCQTIKKADSIMFFDYPPSQEILEEILKKVSPRHIHYMYNNFTNFDEQEIIKTISGMAKFVCNNQNGIFDLQKGASFLGLTTECIEILLQIFNECNNFSIIEQNEKFYKLQYKNNIEISKVLKCPLYLDFKEILKEISSFKKNVKNQIFA